MSFFAVALTLTIRLPKVDGRPVPGAKKENFELELKVSGDHHDVIFSALLT